MAARISSEIAAQKAFKASPAGHHDARDVSKKNTSFLWQRLPPETRQNLIILMINDVLNQYLEPGHRVDYVPPLYGTIYNVFAVRFAFTTAEAEKELKVLMKLMKTVDGFNPDDYAISLKIALSRLVPELAAAKKELERLSVGCENPSDPAKGIFLHPARHHAWWLKKKLEYAVERFEDKILPPAEPVKNVEDGLVHKCRRG